MKEGGVVEHLIHEVEIECKATAVPEKIVVNINQLKLGEAITVADLALPEGAKCHADPDDDRGPVRRAGRRRRRKKKWPKPARPNRK